MLSFAGSTVIDPKTNRRMLVCSCLCGGTTLVRPADLRSGRRKSCGCLKKASLRLGAAASIKHGKAHSSTWRIYYAMLRRCYQLHNEAYDDYGGRGISVCDRWRAGFENFLADMGEKPKGLTLDRKDNNDNYCPENCRWATWQQQQRNRRSNVVLEAFGEKMTIVEWAERVGLEQATLSRRIRQGVPVEAALTYPVTPRGQRTSIVMK